MFSVTILGSGSAGNCSLIETPGCRVLIDGGLSARQMVNRLALCGVAPQDIHGVLLTHEHSDHACGIDVWCKQFGTPIYCNSLTKEVLQRDTAPELRKEWRIFATGADFHIRDIAVQSFPIPHDAVDPVGFILHHGNASLGVLTDLGIATKLVYERVRQVHTLIIETNHDEKLLQNDTRRPWSVKQRIMSRHGHLSNAAAADVLAELLSANLQRALLGHLSRDCNSPELAVATVRDRLRAVGGEYVDVICATQREITPRYTIGSLPGPGMQLDLFGSGVAELGSGSRRPLAMASDLESAS